MQEIQIFTNKMFGEIRTMTNENGEVFFVGKDVAQALGYAKSRNALAAHVDADDKKDALIQGPLGGRQRMTVINESGLYSLVLSSKLAEPRGQEAARHPAQLSGEQHRESGKNNQHCAVQRVGGKTQKHKNTKTR